MSKFTPDWNCHPGQTIADILEEQGLDQVELADRLGFTAQQMNQLLNGYLTINGTIALKLSRELGGTAQFWLNLDSNYRSRLP